MAMAIRDEDLFEATSPLTVLQHGGLESRDVPSTGRSMFWVVLVGMTLIPFVPIPLIEIPPDAFLRYLKGLLF